MTHENAPDVAEAMGLRFGVLFPPGHRFFDVRAARHSGDERTAA